ncbi:MAG: VOC family protein [Metallibacterium scheffleri]|jgi:catechol 2,3-dioxygenase-like lactoylglutathione lyase family enzyme|uniref:VOC family protein n=1 Tax=Metallibacterium scheffleri TaxID=993689 RepID=UPI0026F128B3|nr:VOC family protein [Metallibacterium scheffleri]MCK9366095.1 VOC family protein [Metallibacterium scheffleri]
MTQSLAAIALLVPDYDQAIAYYTAVMGFELLEDTPREPGKRWVRVAPPGSTGTCLLLARASTDAQRARIGDQTGGRVGLFLHTDDFMRDHRMLSTRGVHFREAPRHESYGTVAVFEDCYGNAWDLIEPRA